MYRLKLLITIEEIESEAENGFIAICPSIPNCRAKGETHVEAWENIRAEIDRMLRDRDARSLPLTIPVYEYEYVLED